MKLEEAKNEQNLFKSNQNKIKKGKFRSEEETSASENVKIRYNARN